jgi:pyruvate dehydrogenase E2 component (dihydrolipoamide acetyltransferase)
MIEFRLPSLGADMERGKLLEWKVKPGDRVKRGDIVAVVDTTKAAVEVEIWDEGVVHQLVVQPGDEVPVGTVLAFVLAPGETPAPAARARISPAARQRAAELGIDLAKVQAGAPDGTLTLEDVERLAAAPRVAPPAGATAPQRQAEMRRAIAAAMSRSKREIPHYYLSHTVPLARATAWLEAQNAIRPLPERMLMAVLLVRAVALACKRFPDMNGHYAGGEFRPATAVHCGVAISLRRGGLVAPALHDAGGKPLAELMRGLGDLVKRARAGSLRSSEMSDPTITVTNLGEGGVETVLGVIYPPQVALVGFGAAARRPWADGESLRALPVTVASLSADHRVSDGHRGALFLAEIARRLQEPENL